MAKSKLTPAELKARKAETKGDKFVRLANLRVNNIMKAMKRLAALGSNAYESTEMQRKAIDTAMTTQLRSTIDSLAKVKAPSTLFKL